MPGKGHPPAVKPPPGTSNPKGGGGEKGAGQNPDVHPGKGMSIPQVARLEKRLSCGVGSSSGKSADEGEGTLRRPPVIRESAGCHLGYGSSEEGEGTLLGTDMEVSMEENQSRDRKGPQLEDRAQTMRVGQS